MPGFYFSQTYSVFVKQIHLVLRRKKLDNIPEKIGLFIPIHQNDAADSITQKKLRPRSWLAVIKSQKRLICLILT